MRFKDTQITRLTAAIVVGYPGDAGRGIIKMVLSGIGIDFGRFEVPNGNFELTLNDILRNLNQGGGLEHFFQNLNTDPRQEVTDAIALLLAEPAPPQATGMAELSKALLIVDGDPFVDHESLANTILPALLDPNNMLRAVYMTGPTDSGKTFSVKLIQRLCREAPLAQRFRPIPVDLTALAMTRDCMGVAMLVKSWLKLEDLIFTKTDTSDARIGNRLVTDLSVAREYAETVVPILLVFDHLDKDVAPQIIDFVEELALAAARGTLRDVRIIAIGFPRAPATTFPLGKQITDPVVQPNPALVFQYMDRALGVLDRDMTDDELNEMVTAVFAGQQQPYPRPFMLDLPGKIRAKLDGIIRAPTI